MGNLEGTDAHKPELPHKHKPYCQLRVGVFLLGYPSPTTCACVETTSSTGSRCATRCLCVKVRAYAHIVILTWVRTDCHTM